MPSRMTEGWYRAAARLQFEDEGTLEIDDTAVVSTNDHGDDGAYVQAWVWVDDPEFAPSDLAHEEWQRLGLLIHCHVRMFQKV